MKVFYLHGMGGSPRDWSAVEALVPGECLSIPTGLDFQEAAKRLAEPLRSAAPFILCGYSMGGRLAIRIASLLQNQAPSPLRGLVLLSAGMGEDSSASRLERQRADDAWAARARENPPLFWNDWYRQEIFSSFHALSAPTRARWMQDRFSLKIEDLSSQLEKMSPARHGSLLEELLSVKAGGISVLYIAGERDKKYKNIAKQLGEKGIAADLVPAGHILPLECPETVAEKLRQFLETQKKGS